MHSLDACAKPAPNLSTAPDASGCFTFLRLFVKIALELVLLVRTVAEWLVLRVATSTQPDLVLIHLNVFPALSGNLEVALDVVRAIIPGGNNCSRHLSLR